jgi:hypothetical protein
MGIFSMKKGIIKSVQRGTVSLDGTNAAIASITSVNITKSVLIVSGTGLISVGGTVTAARSFQITFDSATQIRIAAQAGTGTTVTGTASWQVIEYN